MSLEGIDGCIAAETVKNCTGLFVVEWVEHLEVSDVARITSMVFFVAILICWFEDMEAEEVGFLPIMDLWFFWLLIN